jgi:hypothetical protein
LIKNGSLNIDMKDEITRDTLVARDGEVISQRIRDLLGIGPVPPPKRKALPKAPSADDEYELEEPQDTPQ